MFIGTYPPYFYRGFDLICLLAGVSMVLLVPVAAAAQSVRSIGEDSFVNVPRTETDVVTAQERKLLMLEESANIQRLTVEGKLGARFGPRPAFSWPTRSAPGSDSLGFGVIPFYVDHNPAFPNMIMDWNCGMRTYDDPSGNDHRGTDIVGQAFTWRNSFKNDSEVVAAAQGVIIAKNNGAFDRNCDISGNTPVNSIRLLHADGSITRYLHFKNGSLTHKEIGDEVADGEYLGIQGSSGRSNIAHLHFEVVDAGGALQDPFEGACNLMNDFSWWKIQEPYRKPQVLDLMTGSAPIELLSCPNEEITNKKVVFQGGDTLITTALFRDQLSGHVMNSSIIRPNGTVFASWTTISPDDFNYRYWFRTWTVPVNPMTGTWTYRLEYLGNVYERKFYVGTGPSISVSGRIADLVGNSVAGAWIKIRGITDGFTRTARSNPFGRYDLSGIPVGQEYEVTVKAKGLDFNDRVIMPVDDVAGMDLSARNYE